MRKISIIICLQACICLGVSLANTYHSITVNGDLTDWDTDSERWWSSTSGKNGYMTWDADSFYVGFDGVNINDNGGDNQSVFVGIDFDPMPGLSEGEGDSMLPYEQWYAGSTVHLPFNADLLYSVKAVSGLPENHAWIHDGVQWQRDGAGGSDDLSTEFSSVWYGSACEIAIPRSHFIYSSHIHTVIYAKDLSSNGGWGWLYSGVPDNGVTDGTGDKTFIHHYGFRLGPEIRPNDGVFYDAAQGHLVWSPDPPGPNDDINIVIRDCSQAGFLHWGVNAEDGSWSQPISYYWPPGTIPSGTSAVETPLSGPDPNGECTVQLGPFDTGEQLVMTADFVIRWADDSWENNGGADYQIPLWFEPDAGEPTVSIIAPPADTSYIQGATVNVSWTTGGAVQSTLWIDGNDVATSSPYIWDTTTDSLGLHVLTAEAENASGDVSFDFISIFVIPTVSDSVPPPGTKPGVSDNGDGTVTFALWAPEKRFVSLVGDFNGWDDESDILYSYQDSIWWTTIPLMPGTYNYRFLVDGDLPIADPYARRLDWTENGSQSGDWRVAESVVEVSASDFSWTDASWTPPDPEDMIIYETHLGDFSPGGDFAGLEARLSYLATLGINAIEIMPCYEFPGAISWGYNPAFYFAPEATYGTPEDLKNLVDAAHENGIAILIDMVYNHLDASASLYRLYGTDYDASPWFHDVTNPWGFPDLDHWSDGTKQLTKDIAEFWMDEYHVDGFRYDATAFIGWDGVGDDTGNGIGYFTYVAWDHNNSFYQVLEHLPQETDVVTNTKATSCWHDTFHDQMKANLREGQFEGSSYGNMNITAQAIHYAGDGFTDESQVVNYTESHDEQRIMWEAQTNPSIDYDLAVKKSKLGATLLFTATGTPMMYHGQEFGEDSERTIDPNPLNWEYLEQPVGSGIFRHFSRLIWLRRNYPSLTSGNLFTTLQDNTNHVISYWRATESNTDSVVVVANFDRADKTVSVDFPVTGTWYEFLGDSMVSVSSSPRAILVPGSDARIYCRRKLWTTEDTIPPAMPGSLFVMDMTDSIKVSWAAVITDSVGGGESVAYYDVFRNTVPYFDLSSETFLISTTDTVVVDDTPPAGNVYYRIRAWDTSGNSSPGSMGAGRFFFNSSDSGSIQMRRENEGWINDRYPVFKHSRTGL